MAWHYLGRTLALILFTGGVVVLLRNRDVVRYDATEGKVSSLAPATKELIRNLDPKQPIKIDAFISSDIPEQYAKTRYELVNLLKEFQSEANKGARTIEVTLHDDIELFSDEANLAEERFQIVPVERVVRDRGIYQQKRLILGAALRSGLQKVTIPVFEYGIPVEYELVRSIDTVARGTRKRLGIVETDAQMTVGLSSGGLPNQQQEKHPLVRELEKQYDVESVDLTAPVLPGQYDALLAVQPSSMDPERFDRLVEAVKAGVPTAVFEDPFPIPGQWRSLPGTGEPRMGPGGFMGGMGGMQPKGEIRKLWDALGLDVPGEPGMQGLFSPTMVWQQYNPYPNLALAPNDLWTFIDNETTFDNSAISEANPITSGLRQVLMLYGGAVAPGKDTKLVHTPLLSTGPLSGQVALETARAAMNSPDPNALQRVEGEPTGPSTMAIAIEAQAAKTTGEEGTAEAASSSALKAVYVADVDLMLPVFLQLRADPNQVEQVKFQFQNVTFLLNTIDWLTGENAFLEVRKHEPTFSSLRLIEEVKEDANANERTAVKKFQSDFDEAIRELEEENQRQLTTLEDKIKEIRKKGTTGQVDQAELQSRLQEFQIKQGTLQQALAVKKSKFEREMNNQTQAIRRTADLEVVRIQNRVKALAVSLPCIPPLLVGIVVFTSRRLRERDNISKSRLK